MRERSCTACHGKRLKPVVLAITVDGLNIMDICDLSVEDAIEVIARMKLTDEELFIARPIVKEVNARLDLCKMSVPGYLSLSRAANTLSGGEVQRIRLATQIGAGLQGVLYGSLDEPSIGLGTSVTMTDLSTRSNTSEISATRCSSLSMTRIRLPKPTISSTSGRAPVSTVVRSSLMVRLQKSRKIPTVSRDATCLAQRKLIYQKASSS